MGSRVPEVASKAAVAVIESPEARVRVVTRAGSANTCPSCGRGWGGGVACQFCDQVDGLPEGVHLSSPAKRLGGYLLEGVFIVVLLFFGWLIWALIVYSWGQTPAKQVLGMRIVSLRRGQHASWGRTFLREWIAKPIAGIVCILTFGIGYFWLVWDSRNQELWDKMVGTIVVNDPQRLMRKEVTVASAPLPLDEAQDVRNWT
jgi:uncharacterized RDD family membrane protein YckC